MKPKICPGCKKNMLKLIRKINVEALTKDEICGFESNLEQELTKEDKDDIWQNWAECDEMLKDMRDFLRRELRKMTS